MRRFVPRGRCCWSVQPARAAILSCVSRLFALRNAFMSRTKALAASGGMFIGCETWKQSRASPEERKSGGKKPDCRQAMTLPGSNALRRLARPASPPAPRVGLSVDPNQLRARSAYNARPMAGIDWAYAGNGGQRNRHSAVWDVTASLYFRSGLNPLGNRGGSTSLLDGLLFGLGIPAPHTGKHAGRQKAGPGGSHRPILRLRKTGI